MRETTPAHTFVLPALLAMLLCAAPASSALIEFTLEGTIVSGIGSDTPPWDFVEDDDAFQVRFVYESDTQGFHLPPHRTFYLDVVQELSVSIGDVSETASTGDIEIVHGFPIADGEVVDRFVLDGVQFSSGWVFNLLLGQPYFPAKTDGIFGDGSLPESLPLDTLVASSFVLNSPQGGGYVGRVLTSSSRVVPCPWAGALFAYILLPSRKRNPS